MERKEKLLLVGGDIATPDAIRYCKSIGVYTIMTNDIPYENNPYKQMADESWEIPVEELDILEAKCREVGVTGVFAGTNEHNIDMTQALAKRLGLPFYASDEGWACNRDKGRFKEHCRAVGLDVPKRYPLSKPFAAEILKQIAYPVIVKPVDGSAARGISVCHTEEELREAFDKAYLHSNVGDVIVEDYIEGIEVGLTYSFVKQQPVIHTVSASYPVLLGKRRAFALSTPSLYHWADFEKRYSSIMKCLFERLGIKYGSLNIQTVYKDGRYYILEIGYRLDGAGAWNSYKKQSGYSPLEMHVDFQLGRKERDWRPTVGINPPTCMVSVCFLYCSPGKIKKIIGVDELKNMDGVTVTTNRFHEGDVVSECNDLYQTAFICMLETKDEAATINLMKNINNTVHFYNEEGKDMLVYLDDYACLNEV